MRLKIFTVKSGNSTKKNGFGHLEANVNKWLFDHPDITIEHTHDLAQPNLGWGHTALAVWYTEA
jgi:hypothetical protein